MKARLVLAATLAAAAAAGAHAAILYKSVGPNGVLMFSDVPPPEDARILEEREIPTGARASAAAGMPFVEYDEALARANAQVDLAEHALALARRPMGSPRDGLRLEAPRMSRSDEERVEFYKRGVAAARQSLLALLRERQLAMR